MSKPASPKLVIGIGASEATTEALTQFLSSILSPANSVVSAVVVLQHNANKYCYELASTLSSLRGLTLCEVPGKFEVEAGKCYLIAPSLRLETSHHSLILRAHDADTESFSSIDSLFNSLASAFASKAVAIVLSESDFHCHKSLNTIRASGGLTLAQWPQPSENWYEADQAIAKGAVDQLLDISDMQQFLFDYLKSLEPTPSQRNSLDHVSATLLQALDPSVVIDAKNRIIAIHGQNHSFAGSDKLRLNTSVFDLFEATHQLRIREAMAATRKARQAKTVNCPAPLQKNPERIGEFAVRITPLFDQTTINGAYILSFMGSLPSDSMSLSHSELSANHDSSYRGAMVHSDDQLTFDREIGAMALYALSTPNMDDLLEQIVRNVAQTLGADRGEIWHYMPSQKRLLLKAGFGCETEQVGKATMTDNIGTLVGFTLRSPSPVIVDNLQLEHRFKAQTMPCEQGVVSGMTSVIENGAQPYGVLKISTFTPRKFKQTEALFLSSTANILSIALKRSRTDQKLIENEKRLRIAKDSNAMGSFEFMIQTGELSWDELLINIWGIETDQVTLDDFYQGLHPDDVELVSEAIDRAVTGKDDGHYEANYRVINRKTKQVSWIEATGQVIFEKAEAIKMIGMVIDITEKMQLESSLKAAVRQLQEANEKKNEFLATLGHEIRNPLAAINSGVQIIERDQSKLKTSLHMIENNVSIISSLLDDLLDLTRISRGQIKLNKQSVNLNELMTEIYHGFLRQCEEKRQHTELILPNETVVCFLDKIRIQQVIGNIINNAHKFTPKGGRISISMSKRNDQVEITIEDNGIGMDMQFKDIVFEPFHQLSSDCSKDNAGLGIGLSLVKQFTLLHDGAIVAHSDGPHTGTKFVLTLPICSSNEQSNVSTVTSQVDIDSAPRATQRDKLKDVSVLIVDDNEDAAYGLSLILEMKGCQVYPCYDGQSALKSLDSFTPNVLILDIGLPDMTGYELLQSLKAKLPKDTHSIALTGYGHQEAKDKSRQAGFNHHMNKPVNFEQLLVLLSNHNLND